MTGGSCLTSTAAVSALVGFHPKGVVSWSFLKEDWKTGKGVRKREASAPQKRKRGGTAETPTPTPTSCPAWLGVQALASDS